MAKRVYKQYCALARTLDRVGERWTLLLIRNLLTGPKRFKDLLADLPGIGTNLLSDRLKLLERDGLVRKINLPPPSEAEAYELTEIGRGLEPAIVELVKWGLRYLGRPKRGEAFRAAWSLLAMQATFRPERARGVSESYEYRIAGEVFHVRVDGGVVTTRQGPAIEPDMVLSTDDKTFLALGTGQIDAAEALTSGKIELMGGFETLQRSIEIFGV